MALNNDRLKQLVLLRSAALGLGMLAVIGLILLLVGYRMVGTSLLVVGGLSAAFLAARLLMEQTAVLSGRRGAAGMQVLTQVLLAAILLIGLNAFSFFHYLRFDWTRDRLFTLAPEIQEQLRQLK